MSTLEQRAELYRLADRIQKWVDSPRSDAAAWFELGILLAEVMAGLRREAGKSDAHS